MTIKFILKKANSRLIFLVFGILFFSLIFFSCSRNEPRIPFGIIKLVYFQGEGEKFSFFIIAEDDDGIENLDSLYLYHDREGLRWQLSSEDWVTVTENGKTWLGSRTISMPDNQVLPRGQFRAVLTNKGGEKTERFFSFDAPTNPRYPFPILNIEDGRYTIVSRYPEHFFICYDDSGNYIRTVPIANLQDDISSLGFSSAIRAVSLWAEDAEYYTSALTDISPLN